MTTPPRDAGIPMLTEVIDEETELVGPLAPENTLRAQHAPEEQPAVLPDPDPVTASAPVAPALPVAPADGSYVQAPAVGIQYGPPPQYAPSYPLPLRPAASSTPAPAPAFTSAPINRETPQADMAAPLPAPMSDEEWLRMERRLRERILGQLLSRTDAMLEERIRNSVAGVLEQAVDGLAATLRASLHKTLEDVVSRAVAQEITRLQSTIK
ncbi:MAG: hypothetical protein EOO80_18435 [Oxalobacteraceae bacterium]|nr:MAG: hypothetical protein EOO80_18435 [Oxalobacteraceae bacterium]